MFKRDQNDRRWRRENSRLEMQQVYTVQYASLLLRGDKRWRQLRRNKVGSRNVFANESKAEYCEKEGLYPATLSPENDIHMPQFYIRDLYSGANFCAKYVI